MQGDIILTANVHLLAESSVEAQRSDDGKATWLQFGGFRGVSVFVGDVLKVDEIRQALDALSAMLTGKPGMCSCGHHEADHSTAGTCQVNEGHCDGFDGGKSVAA